MTTIPVTVLTGFLGSGKTTLLTRALSHPALSSAAVLVNEVGDVALDHLLVREAREELLLLEGGCVCCSMRGDLERALDALASDVREGRIDAFSRVIIETTGLADPTPILATLTARERREQGVHVSAVVVTVDAELGPATLATHEEARKQVRLADRVVITKTDRAPADAATDAVRALAPSVPLLQALGGETDLGALFAPAIRPDRPDLGGWLVAQDHEHEHHHDDPTHDHDDSEHEHDHDGVVTFTVKITEPLDFRAFAAWLSFLTQFDGERLLRVKGLLRARGEREPLVVQSTQHVVSPVRTLPAWPDDRPETRLVFIVRDVSPERRRQIRASLRDLAADRSAR